MSLFPKSIAYGAALLAGWAHAQGLWQMVAQSNAPIARQENAFAQAGPAFYLMGGRQSQKVEAYDFAKKTWAAKAASPLLMHHFQATEYHGILVVAAAMTGNYPAEPSVPDIWYYDPVGDVWAKGPPMPTDRVRGSAGAIVYQDKFYLACGNTRGHNSGWVKWLDEWDPATNVWKKLPDAPHARDHFNAKLYAGKIFCGGGRRSSADLGNTFGDTEAKVDVYDIAAGSWSTLANPIPTPRGGPITGLVGEEIIYFGGESLASTNSLAQCEALNVVTGQWRTLSNSISPRQGTQAIVSNDGIYAAAGSPTRGGGTTNTQVSFFPAGTATQPIGDAIVPGTMVSTDYAATRIAGKGSDTLIVPLTYGTGNQAILISDLKLTGGVGVKMADAFTFPLLLLPGKSLNVHLTLDASVKTAGGSLVASGLIPKAGAFTRKFSLSDGPSAISAPQVNASHVAVEMVGRTAGTVALRLKAARPENLRIIFSDVRGREIGAQNVSLGADERILSFPIQAGMETPIKWKIMEGGRL